MHPIKRYRQAKGWTQGDLANELGVNVNSVVGWEKGAAPRPKVLVRLAEALGMSSLQLVNEIEQWKRQETQEVA